MTDRNSLYAAVLKVNHAGGSGSCFYLKRHNLFVTNYHVIEGFHTVALQDNDRRAWRAHVVLANPARDIALLAAEGDFSTLPELTLATEEPLIGDKIRVAGYPFGMPFTLTEGSISSPDQLMDGSHYIQTDAAVNPGNSGGPMLNLRNEVIAITVSKLTDADNMGFGIPVDALRPMLERTGELDATTYRVQCPGCDEFIAGEEEYCPSCGVRLPEGVFRERGLTDLAKFCEKAIAAMGVDPCWPASDRSRGASTRGAPKSDSSSTRTPTSSAPRPSTSCPNATLNRCSPTCSRPTWPPTSWGSRRTRFTSPTGST